MYNPVENKSLGPFDYYKFKEAFEKESIVKNKNYPGKLLFCKKWEENKIFSIEERDFIEGKWEKIEEVKELKFPKEIGDLPSGKFEMYSLGDRLVCFNLH